MWLALCYGIKEHKSTGRGVKKVVTLIRDKKGQALVLVLILLLIGGLIIAPLLALGLLQRGVVHIE